MKVTTRGEAAPEPSSQSIQGGACDRFGQANAAVCWGSPAGSDSRDSLADSIRSRPRIAGAQLPQQDPAPQAARTSPRVEAPLRMARWIVRSEIPLQWQTSMGVFSFGAERQWAVLD